jgi:NAD(P)-dependent dehydrogenase (short-subunit alcohol dehydrogenase family)
MAIGPLRGNYRRDNMGGRADSTGRLDGKVAIITGATGGIGEATAKLFLDEGAKVMLVARSAEKLKATVGRLAVDEGLAHCVADVADEKAVAAAVAATVETFGGVDVLLANAGTEGVVRPLEEQSYEGFEQVLRTNVLGVWLSMKYCVGPMKKRGGGSMIALSSMAGVIGFPGLAPYVASKHAVCGLVKTAALEFGDSGIRVNAIGPGPIANRMTNEVVAQISPDDSAAVHEAVKAQIPMKRYGTNEEVAHLALFLASDESTYCTGAIHMIDGGFVAA